MDQPAGTTRDGDLRLLAVAPLLIVASLVVIGVSNSLVVIGPFDRAQIGWGVGVPLFLLAPGAAALAGRDVGSRAAAWSVGAIAVSLASLTIVGLFVSMTAIGCAPATPLEAFARAIPVGLAAGLGFAVAASAAWLVRGRALVALALGALLAFGAIFATILVWAGAFIVGVSCAYVPG